MTQRVHRKRGMLIDPEETPPLHFGHKLRVDYIIIGSDLTKGSEGEQACLICYDENSGSYQAFPQTNRTTDKIVWFTKLTVLFYLEFGWVGGVCWVVAPCAFCLKNERANRIWKFANNSFSERGFVQFYIGAISVTSLMRYT